MNIIFAGTPTFAAVALQALLNSSHTITAVYTQPDRPAGRGRHLTASPVKQLAEAHGLPVYQPITLGPLDQQQLTSAQPDIIIVAAYGLLLPKWALTLPCYGCVNIHASLLPRWRGAAPIQRAILAGDRKTGISIMQMDEGLDTGDVLSRAECAIHDDDTSETLHDRLAALGAETLLTTLQQLPSLSPGPQDAAYATYAKKIFKEEAHIDWQLPASEIAKTIRAFNPWPVAFTYLGEEMVRIWQATIIEQGTATLPPGKIFHTSAAGIDVAAGQDAIRIIKMQLPGGRLLPVADILNARAEQFAVGKAFKKFKRK